MNIIELMEDFETRFHLDSQRRAEKTLVLPTATLIVAPSGITAKMWPPFSRLSRHYPWQHIPPSFAALRILAVGEQCETIQMVERSLGLNQRVIVPADPDRRRGITDSRDPDQRALEETDTWCADVEKIVRWGVGLADVCPDATVARDLKSLPNLGPRELDHYMIDIFRSLQDVHSLP